jgi:hypothetical protein
MPRAETVTILQENGVGDDKGEVTTGPGLRSEMLCGHTHEPQDERPQGHANKASTIDDR